MKTDLKIRLYRKTLFQILIFSTHYDEKLFTSNYFLTWFLHSVNNFNCREYSSLAVVRIAKRWTSNERAITQSNANIFDSCPARF